MKNKFSFLTALWWILLLAVLGFFLLAATDKHSRESEDENRMLAAFPTLSGKSLADASFMNGFEDFLSDAFFGREGVTKFTDRVMDKFSVLTAEEEAVQKAEEMDRRLQAEGAAIRERLPKGGAVVALCIEGKPCSSEELSRRMADFGVQGKTQITFLIGGSVGLSEDVKKLADWRLSMSPMTFPHHMARIMLLEQLYRAYQIAAGTKYHK